MLAVGLVFLAAGVASELMMGTNFEQMFDLDYPRKTERWSAHRITVRLNRLTILFGLVVAAVGAVVSVV